jgi:hypothetical protein
MKPISLTAIVPATLLAITLTGCVVAPLGVRPAYHAPAGVVYVAPTYAAPAYGYRWSHHGHHGWGWHHHRHGWHRGWR